MNTWIQIYVSYFFYKNLNRVPHKSLHEILCIGKGDFTRFKFENMKRPEPEYTSHLDIPETFIMHRTILQCLYIENNNGEKEKKNMQSNTSL